MSPVTTWLWMEALLPATKRLAVALALAICTVYGGEPRALYISPAGHNFRAEGMPLHDATDVTASLGVVRDMGVRRIYWRGFQEDYLMRHAVVRKANFQLADYWNWMRETENRGIHRAALGVKGLEVWGVFGLFDLGADPREDAYCGAAAGYGPAVWSDSLREKYPEEIPLDLKGIRRECGPLRWRKPEVRAALIERLSRLMKEGYAGLLLYTYAENLSLWHVGEFGAPLERSEVEVFLRELREALKGKKLALQVDARAAFRDGPAPWLGLTPDTNTIGTIPVAWEDWIREGLLDEVVFSIGPGAGGEATKLCEAMTLKYPQVRFSLLTREVLPPPSSCPLIVDARSSGFREKFLERARAVKALETWAQSTAGSSPPFGNLETSAEITAGLGKMKSPPAGAVEWLVETVKSHGEFPLRQQAAETLAAWNAVEAIGKLASDNDAGVRQVAYLAAGKLTSFETARPLLEKAVNDKDAHNRWAGFRGLGRAPFDVRLQTTLQKGLADSDATVRSVAAWLVRPGQNPEQALFQALCDRFVALHKEDAWSWEYRPVGDALMHTGEKGRAFLEKCLRQTESPAMADSAWRCLFIPQTGGELKLVSEAEADKAYEAYPEHLRTQVPRAAP